MLLSVQLVLVLIAFGLTLVSGISGRVPLWIAVLLLCIVHLVSGVAR
jgi:hypothetical protein